MPFNGPGSEPRNVDLPDGTVYCVQCGTIFVSAAPERDCPSCTLAERLDELEDQLDQAKRDIDIIDGGL